MAELAVIETDDKQEQDDFAAGFDANVTPDKPAATVPPAPAADAKTPTTDAAAAPKDASEAAPEPPKYVQLTQAEWDAVKTAAAKADGLEKRIKDTVGGTVGELEQRILKRLQPNAAAPAADQSKPAAEVLPPEPREWTQAVKDLSVQYQLEQLEDLHPTWREIVGTVDSDGKHDSNNEFRKWLGTQPAEYQHKINHANSASVVSRAIDKFNAAKATPPKAETPAPKIAARNDRIRAAIQPRGDGGQPASSKSADDEFSEGFRTG